MNSNDILVVHQNRIIFRSGQGRLTQHSKISATVTQVLSLFSQKIMGGEQIHFIRFAHHRMIFLFPQDRRENDLVGIVLIPIERSARQVVPTMGIILNLIEQFLRGDVLDAQNRHLDTFYQILTAPSESLFVIPRTAEGILSALVLLTAFAHDMRFGVESIVPKLMFFEPTNSGDISAVIQASKTSRILTFATIPGTEDNDNILTFGVESPLKQYFSANPGEQVYDVLSRILGENSNAAKMRRFIDNNDAREIAQSIALFPATEDDYVRYNILLSTVIQPGKDIVVTMSAPVMHKLRGLTPKVEVQEKTILEKLIVESSEVQTPAPAISPPPINTTTASPSVELAAEPDAIPTPRVLQGVIQPPVSTEVVSPDLFSQLQKTREEGFQYRFDDFPVVLDLAPYELNFKSKKAVPTADLDITISLFKEEDDKFTIHFYTHFARLNSIKESFEDISSRIGGNVEIHENYVSLESPIVNQKTAVRGVLWLSIVEYLTQVEMNIKSLSSRFNIPRDGSILIIPPGRDFVKAKIPSKFQTFIYESEVRKEHESEDLGTLGSTLDTILSKILAPLVRGEGVVLVASDSNQEMEEIALFLLLISELCGIGFSRW
jgi:hypothetical protein